MAGRQGKYRYRFGMAAEVVKVGWLKWTEEKVAAETTLQCGFANRMNKGKGQ
jgi:hypothetical protein